MSEKIHVQVGVKGRSIPAGGKAGMILQKATDEDFDLIWTEPAGGASANIPQPGVTTPLPDTGAGSAGTGVAFAPIDHYHPFNVPTTGTPQMDGTASLGTSTKYAKADHIHPTDTSRASATDLSTLDTAVTNYKNSFVAFTVTLDEDDWADGEQTITDAKFITSGYAYIVTPSPSDIEKYSEAEIYAEDVSVASEMTFHCGEEPTDDIVVNVVRIPV